MLTGEQFSQTLRSLVLTNHAGQRRMRAQRNNIARHIRGSAKAIIAIADTYHGHGSLRRDAADIAEPVAVQHQVADDEDADCRDDSGELISKPDCALRFGGYQA